MIFPGHEIAKATGGRLVIDGPSGAICTDTRKLQPGQWFLALVGERFDSHNFLETANKAQCAGIIAHHAPEGWSRGFVEVPDTLIALQDLARHGRRCFPGPVVAITGSVGKTTTRTMIALALESLGPVHQTDGNFNNHIGLPLTILAAPVDAAVWVLEMGMNHAGEIQLLQDIAKPTIRVITNVGAAHLEGLGSIEGVAAAKGELFDGARPGDILCINADDPLVDALHVPPGAHVLRYGSSDPCNVMLTDAVIDRETLSTRYRIETPHGIVRGTLRSPGLHLAHNATAAVAVSTALGAPSDGLGERIGKYQPIGMRLRVENGPRGEMIINDAYNANPMSMAASLKTLSSLTSPREHEENKRIALLGDMLEMGAGEAQAHEGVLSLAKSLPLDLIGIAGPRFAAAARELGMEADPKLIIADDAVSLGHATRSKVSSQDLVLLKGSRGLHMEQILLTWKEADPGAEVSLGDNH